MPKLDQPKVDAAYRMFYGEGKNLGQICQELGCGIYDLSPWLTVPAMRSAGDMADAERFRALMRCGRIKMQGSAGVDSKTGERTYPDDPGSVHFGAEFWVQPEDVTSKTTAWGRHCIRALADDILAYEAASGAAEG